MLQQNLIISLPTYPKFCWYATGTTHIFHLGLRHVIENKQLIYVAKSKGRKQKAFQTDDMETDMTVL